MNIYVRTSYKTDYDVGLDHKDYTAIDIETTGLDEETDEIIELAAVRYRDGEEVDRFQSLVKPKGSISDFIEDLTGINTAMVSDAPEIAEVLPSYLLFLGDDVLLGHNIKFDMGFIDEATESLGLNLLSNKWNDTMLLSRDIFKGKRNHKLKDLCSRLNIPQLQEHRALSDCIRTHLCYEAMKDYCDENNIILRKRSASDQEESSQENKSSKSEETPLEWDESKLKSLSDQDFYAYAKMYMNYAKVEISTAESMSKLGKTIPSSQSQEQIDKMTERVEEIGKHTAFLNSEISRRKLHLDNYQEPPSATKESSTGKPFEAFLSFWLLLIGAPIAIAGLVLSFFGEMITGAAFFFAGLILLLVCYFNQ